MHMQIFSIFHPIAKKNVNTNILPVRNNYKVTRFTTNCTILRHPVQDSYIVAKENCALVTMSLRTVIALH